MYSVIFKIIVILNACGYVWIGLNMAVIYEELKLKKAETECSISCYFMKCLGRKKISSGVSAVFV